MNRVLHLFHLFASYVASNLTKCTTRNFYTDEVTPLSNDARSPLSNSKWNFMRSSKIRSSGRTFMRLSSVARTENRHSATASTSHSIRSGSSRPGAPKNASRSRSYRVRSFNRLICIDIRTVISSNLAISSLMPSIIRERKKNKLPVAVRPERRFN